jgi:hypothetical protein
MIGLLGTAGGAVVVVVIGGAGTVGLGARATDGVSVVTGRAGTVADV